jgi:acid phosphatase (class A)
MLRSLTNALIFVFISGIAAAADAPPLFLPTGAIDLPALLEPPPAQDSATTKSEIELVRKTQATATDAEKKLAIADAVEDVFVLGASVLGPNFTAANLPTAAAFFAKVHHTEGEFVDPAKKTWNRLRPPLADPAIVPCTKLSMSGAYPSGHATSGYLWGIVLAQMVPEKSAAIFARAAEYGHSRIVCGMHYPTDIEAGRISAAVIAAALMSNPNFKSEFGPARAEIRKLLGLPASG